MILLFCRENTKYRRKLQMNIETTDWTKKSNTYLVYKRMFDLENGTDYAKQHYEKYVKHVENVEATIETEPEVVEYNDGKQRNIVGNYGDPNVLIKKCFNHLNAMKRAKTLSQQNDDYMKLFHENIEYRERDALELTLRTLQTIIKNQK